MLLEKALDKELLNRVAGGLGNVEEYGRGLPIDHIIRRSRDTPRPVDKSTRRQRSTHDITDGLGACMIVGMPVQRVIPTVGVSINSTNSTVAVKVWQTYWSLGALN
jgi:hypothetical protein